MIEGGILMVELGLFLVLLLKVWRVQAKGEEEETGFFAYRTCNDPAGDANGPKRPGGAPDA